MWCLISQPNSVVFEVRVDPKAIGQDCLEKVSKPLSTLIYTVIQPNDIFACAANGRKWHRGFDTFSKIPALTLPPLLLK
jgi:hypothetical protein